MGKKVKKKARSGNKERRVSAPGKTPSQDTIPSAEAVEGVLSVKESKKCVHVDTGVDLVNFTSKIDLSEPIRCEDCREGSADRRASKGRGKHGKKRGGASSDSKSESRAVWVCLQCGHFSCGGIGFPTTPQSHAVRHAKQTRHPLAVQFENPNLRWCFPCNMLIPLETLEENGESKDVLADIVKIIKGRSSKGAPVDADDGSFGNGSLTSEIKSGSFVLGNVDGTGGYVVRGLVNLGNTCFFNSVMQNLLAIGRLRDYFLELEGSVGPLTISLKKLYYETVSEAGLRNVINPRSFFGCVCVKAPQFRGYQQHDSHELLRCLLDGLSTEELSSRKKSNSSENNGTTNIMGSTFVDTIFAGQLSSTVCCLECGHSSTVFEPFLDLSLPVPMKKPSSKKAELNSRVKTPKVPPKKSGRVRAKVNRDKDPIAGKSDSTSVIGGESSSQGQSSLPLAESVAASSGVSVPSDYNGVIAANEKGKAPQNLSDSQESGDEHSSVNVMEGTVDSSDQLTWLDYLEPEPGTTVDNQDVASQVNDEAVTRISGKKDADQNNVQNDPEPTSQTSTTYMVSNTKDDPSINPWEDEGPLQVQGSEVILLPYNEESSSHGEIIREGEVSSSATGYEQASMEFDGFGDLFNEPEVAEAPSTNPSGTGFAAGNISESDPDEIDDTNSPVSINSCLACFTKPELLTNEHGWHCENCSKVLRSRRMKFRKKERIKIIKEESIQDAALHTHKNCSSPTELKNFHNENENLEIGQIAEQKAVSFRLEGENSLMKAAPAELSHSTSSYKSCHEESFSDQVSDSGSATEHNNAGEHESEDSVDEEMDTKTVKVKRDASKRILINSAPPILTIHLKRFSQDVRGRLSKLNGHVDFKDTIDLTPYMDPRSAESEVHKYHLVGVVEHLGSMRGGHYVAYVRGGTKDSEKTEREGGDFIWYHASDAYVREVSFEEVLCCEAYILFYEKF